MRKFMILLVSLVFILSLGASAFGQVDKREQAVDTPRYKKPPPGL